jgi:hypothetical protein
MELIFDEVRQEYHNPKITDKIIYIYLIRKIKMFIKILLHAECKGT